MKVEWVPLGEVLTQRKSVVVDPLKSYPIAGVYGFGRGVLLRPAILGSETKYTTLTPLKENDVVYSKLKAFEGAVAVAGAGADGYFLSPEFPVFGVHHSVNTRYLRQFLGSRMFLHELATYSTGLGARRERVHPAQFLRILIPLPSDLEQERIAARLDSLETSLPPVRNAVPAPRKSPPLPHLIGDVFRAESLPIVSLGELCANRQELVHPGDDLRGAERFVGLEHVQSHTGRALGSRPIASETGRKLLFHAGQITYGYLRPYLNKVWLADEVGLCSVEQFVLQPKHNVAVDVLARLLRSDFVWSAAKAATNGLQLPRLSLRNLLTFDVPDVRLVRDVVGLCSRIDGVTERIVRINELSVRSSRLAESLLPAARNEIFSAMV